MSKVWPGAREPARWPEETDIEYKHERPALPPGQYSSDWGNPRHKYEVIKRQVLRMQEDLNDLVALLGVLTNYDGGVR